MTDLEMFKVEIVSNTLKKIISQGSYCEMPKSIEPQKTYQKNKNGGR